MVHAVACFLCAWLPLLVHGGGVDQTRLELERFSSPYKGRLDEGLLQFAHWCHRFAECENWKTWPFPTVEKRLAEFVQHCFDHNIKIGFLNMRCLGAKPSALPASII